MALLRSEYKTINPWVLKKIQKINAHRILDVGCGPGFLANKLGREKLQITGVDISSECLDVAKKHDQTHSVHYIQANAYAMPFPDGEFDVVTCMDLLEHVESPAHVIMEISRVLKPKGLFIFHTINRNFISWLIIIKLLPFLIRKTPRNLHLYRMLITPNELNRYCALAHLQINEILGIRPVFSSIPLPNYLKGIVPEGIRFKIIRSLLLTYIGVAQKNILTTH